MKRAAVVRHVPFEDLGSFAEPLGARGYAIQYADAGVDRLDTAVLEQADLLFILGGPIGANDEREFPFLLDELRIIERRLRSGRPIFGVCLGSQLLARALGARIYPAPMKEIGWAAVTLTDDGTRSPLSHLRPDQTPVLHWHGDTFDLPAGALHLASTSVCENQAFQWDRHVLALQFHPEVTVTGLERWFIGHTCEIAATQGVSVAGLRSDTARFAPTLEFQGREFLRAWLDLIDPTG